MSESKISPQTASPNTSKSHLTQWMLTSAWILYIYIYMYIKPQDLCGHLFASLWACSTIRLHFIAHKYTSRLGKLQSRRTINFIEDRNGKRNQFKSVMEKCWLYSIIQRQEEPPESLHSFGEKRNTAINGQKKVQNLTSSVTWAQVVLLSS